MWLIDVDVDGGMERDRWYARSWESNGGYKLFVALPTVKTMRKILVFIINCKKNFYSKPSDFEMYIAWSSAKFHAMRAHKVRF